MVNSVFFRGNSFFSALTDNKFCGKGHIHFLQPQQFPTRKFTTNIHPTHTMIYAVLEYKMLQHINHNPAIVLIINYFNTQIINFNKGILWLIQFFFFVVHIIFSVTFPNICAILVSYLPNSKRLGILSWYLSRITALIITLISYLLFIWFGTFLTTWLVTPR